jgi:hypothetical protein
MLVDGRKTLQTIHQQLGGNIDWITFHQQFNVLYKILSQHNKMTIRYAPQA